MTEFARPIAVLIVLTGAPLLAFTLFLQVLRRVSPATPEDPDALSIPVLLIFVVPFGAGLVAGLLLDAIWLWFAGAAVGHALYFIGFLAGGITPWRAAMTIPSAVVTLIGLVVLAAALRLAPPSVLASSEEDAVTPRTSRSAEQIELLYGAGFVTLCVGWLLSLMHEGDKRRAHAAVAQGEREALLQRLSHTLRTPAAAIGSLTDALERDAVPGEERARYLGLIRGEANRLSTGLERMLRIARDEPMAFAPIVIDAGDWLRGLAERWEPRLPALTVDVAAPLPAARFDPEQMDEALEALLDNAMRHGAPPIGLALEARAGALVFTVRDGGAGIERRAFSRLCQAGERLADAASDAGGFGLGLWVAADVARAHGGRLARSDEGSAIELHLPLKEDRA